VAEGGGGWPEGELIKEKIGFGKEKTRTEKTPKGRSKSEEEVTP